MTKNYKLMLALAVSVICVSAQAADQYFMRVPAPAKCAGASCVMHARPAGTAADTSAPATPKPPVPRGVLTAFTTTDAGMQAIGGNAVGLQFVFKNTGTEPIANVYVTASGNGFTPAVGPLRLTTCGVAGSRLATIQPGATCNAYVLFQPQDRGARPGVVNIVTTDSATPLASLALTGTGGIAKPVLSVDPAAGLDFGAIPLGGSATRSFTYTNAGDAPYILGGPGFWADSLYYAEYTSSRSCEPAAGGTAYVRPGESCVVSITITPTRAEYVYSAYMSSTTPGENINIPLRWTVK